ncbi:hypothetical protein C5167_038954 [Papaver somniferum]|uniref:Uncharacterized protein n=1 Tax=Papaver somniferum TaxID=3469 RepID=A0A4Y7IE90_PAPSO|nr:hypothetical protein C5167_038954 [Papaver somniferum]
MGGGEDGGGGGGGECDAGKDGGGSGFAKTARIFLASDEGLKNSKIEPNWDVDGCRGGDEFGTGVVEVARKKKNKVIKRIVADEAQVTSEVDRGGDEFGTGVVEVARKSVNEDKDEVEDTLRIRGGDEFGTGVVEVARKVLMTLL